MGVSDERQKLGVRSGPQFSPVPHINIEDGTKDSASPEAGASFILDPSPKHRTVAAFRGLSLSIPLDEDEPILTSTSDSPSSSPRLARFRRATFARDSTSNTAPLPSSNAGQQESQKLLAHLLDKLDARLRPPDLLARAAASARNVDQQAQAKRQTVSSLGDRLTQHKSPPAGQQPLGSRGISNEDQADQEDYATSEWDGDETTQLLAQIRDLQLLAKKQDLELFAPISYTTTSAPAETPAKGKRRAGRLSSFVSPVSPAGPGRNRATAPTDNPIEYDMDMRARLTDLICGTLESDSAYKIRKHRPMAPPLMLYSTALDVASLLYETADVDGKVALLNSVANSMYVVRDVAIGKALIWCESRLMDLLMPRYDPDAEAFRDPFAQAVPPTAGVPRLHVTADQAIIPSSTRLPHVSGQSGSHVHGLVARILTAALSTIDICAAPLDTVYSLHHFFTRCLHHDPDMSGSLMGIVAYGPPIARRQAASLLATYLPSAVGHNHIARRLPDMTFRAQRLRIETGQTQVLGEDAEDQHHYLPWRYKDTEERCEVCHKLLTEFAVKCTLCGKGKHWSCSSGNNVSILAVPVDSHEPFITRTVHYSLALPSTTEIAQQGTLKRTGDLSTCRRRIGDHDLHLVNLVQLVTCGICDLPLWGTAEQGYACLADCRSFYHRHCLDELAMRQHPCLAPSVRSARGLPLRASASLDTRTADIDENLRPYCWSPESIADRTYDEVMINYQHLWLQHQIIQNGEVSGTLDASLLRSLANVHVERSLDLCMQRLSQGSDLSPGLADYTDITGMGPSSDRAYLFDAQFFSYIVALCRDGDIAAADDASHRFLSVEWDKTMSSADPEPRSDTTTALTALAIRTCLKQDFAIHQPHLADVIIDRLRLSGKLRIDGPSPYADSAKLHTNIPDIIDNSSSVDTLLSAVEALLEDPDLALNEQGCRILQTRARPSALASPEALQRLQICLLSWIAGENQIIDQVNAQYTSRHQRLPGVRLKHRIPATSIPGSGSSQMYRQTRQQVFEFYVLSWLRQLYELDGERYAQTVHEFCVCGHDNLGPVSDSSVAVARFVAVAERALALLSLLIDAQVTFGCTLDLLAVWLDQCPTDDRDHAYSLLGSIIAQYEQSQAGSDSLWSVIQGLCQGSEDDNARASKWLRVLARSAVEIPWELIGVISDKVQDLCESGSSSSYALASIIDDMSTAISSNTEPCEASHVAQIASVMLLIHLSLDVKDGASFNTHRRLMRLLIHIYNAEASEIDQTCLYADAVPALVMTNRLRLLDFDDNVLEAICSLSLTDTEQTEVCIDFLWLILTHAKSISDAQRIVHVHSEMLSRFIWPLLDLPIDRRCRSRLLLRLIAVNSTPMLRLFTQDLRSPFVRRTAMSRMLQIIMEMADGSVVTGPSQWRAPITPTILAFFEACLAPDVAADRELLSLLSPSHLAAVTVCFEDRLQQASDEDRLEVLGSLIHIHAAIPDWPIISWRLLDELLVEASSAVAQLSSGKSAQHLSALGEARAVQQQLLCLCCDMLASGISTTYMVSIRLQQHIASSYSDLSSLQKYGSKEGPLAALRRLLDSTAFLPEKASSSHALLHMSGDSGRTTGEAKVFRKRKLVGSLAVPVVVEIATLLKEPDVGDKRMIMELLLVVYYKHDCAPVELLAVQALDLVAQYAGSIVDQSEICLALAVSKTGLERLPGASLIRISGRIAYAVSVMLIGAPGVQAVTGKAGKMCTDILASLIKGYGRSGLIPLLLLTDGEAQVDVRSGRQSVLYAAFDKLRHDSAELGSTSDPGYLFYTQLSGILRMKPEELLSSLQALVRLTFADQRRLSAEAVQGIGSFLGRLSKHIADWPASAFDSASVLRVCASVIGRCQSNDATPLLSQVATFVHLSIIRFGIGWPTLQSVMQASAKLAGKSGSIDVIRTVVHDLAMGAIRGGQIQPHSLAALTEFLHEEMANQQRKYPSATQDPAVNEQCAGAMNILLRKHAVFALCAKDPLTTRTICATIAAFVLSADSIYPGSLAAAMLGAGFESEAATNQLLALIYLMAGLFIPWPPTANCDKVKPIHPRTPLVTILVPIAARAVALALRALTDMLSSRDTAVLARSAGMAGDIRMLLKLVIACQAIGSSRTGEAGRARCTFWNRVLPDWLRLLDRSLEVTGGTTAIQRHLHSDFVDFIFFATKLDPLALLGHESALLHMLGRLGPLAGARPVTSGTPVSAGGKQTADRLGEARKALIGLGCGGLADQVDRSVVQKEMEEDLRTFECDRAFKPT